MKTTIKERGDNNEAVQKEIVNIQIQGVALINDEHAKTIILDESGISVDKDGAAAISISWDNISFVRSFEHTICFFSKDRIMLPINKAHKKKIQENLRENKIKIKAIGDLDF